MQCWDSVWIKRSVPYILHVSKAYHIMWHNGVIYKLLQLEIPKDLVKLIQPLELFIFITYFSTVVPLTSCVFFLVGLPSLTLHFQKVL